MKRQILAAAMALLVAVPAAAQQKFNDWGWPQPYEKVSDKSVEWLKSNQPWTPDFERSLVDNGIGHKDQIRMRTPGLASLSAAA